MKIRTKIEILAAILICICILYFTLGVGAAKQTLANQIERRDRPAVIPLLGFMKTYVENTPNMRDNGWMLFPYELPWHDDPESGLQAQLKLKPLTAIKVGESKTRKNDIRANLGYYWRVHLGGICDAPPTLPIILYENHQMHSLWTDLDAITIVVETKKQLDLLADAKPGTLFMPSWLNGGHWASVRDKLILQAKPKEIVYLDCN